MLTGWYNGWHDANSAAQNDEGGYGNASDILHKILCIYPLTARVCTFRHGMFRQSKDKQKQICF
jgi:hypothetical protein